MYFAINFSASLWIVNSKGYIIIHKLYYIICSVAISAISCREPVDLYLRGVIVWAVSCQNVGLELDRAETG